MKNLLKKNKNDLLFIAAIVIACILIRKFIFLPVEVSGSSMSPTLNDGERGFTTVIGRQNVERGDIVVLDIGKEEHKEYLLIKRVIGLPGEKVSITAEGVYINGQLLDEPYAVYDYEMTDAEFLVGDDEVFCMGDNRSHSSDSRNYGPFKIEQIIGKDFMPLNVLQLNKSAKE